MSATHCENCKQPFTDTAGRPTHEGVNCPPRALPLPEATRREGIEALHKINVFIAADLWADTAAWCGRRLAQGRPTGGLQMAQHYLDCLRERLSDLQEAAGKARKRG